MLVTMFRSKRRAWLLAGVVLLGIALVLGAIFRSDPSARAERAMRSAFSRGWAGTNEARQVFDTLSLGRKLDVLGRLLIEPESRVNRWHRQVRSRLPDSWAKKIPRPTPDGPVQFCAYPWLAEALTDTNANVAQIVPIIRARPELFWNVVTLPTIERLRASPENVAMLLPLFNNPNSNVVNIVAYLVANSDLAGNSEPEFRRWVGKVSTYYLGTALSYLIQVTRDPVATADWLWDELASAPADRGGYIAPRLAQLERRNRRERAFFEARLDSANPNVRLGALQCVTGHPIQTQRYLDRLFEMAPTALADEQELIGRECFKVAWTSYGEASSRIKAARVARLYCDPEFMRKTRELNPGKELPGEVEQALRGEGAAGLD